jgi:hypothetical protein
LIESGKLSEGKTKGAFAARDWLALKSHLDEIGLAGSVLDDLLGHLTRASGLILRYPDAARERRRDAFLENLRMYVHATLGEDAEARVSGEVALMAQIERGYRSVLATLGCADISKLSPDTRIAACLAWANRAYTDIMKKQDQEIRKLEQLHFPNVPPVTDEDGNSMPIDPLINAIVTALSTTLIMEAHNNNWHDSSGTVTLPPLPAVSDDEVFKAGTTQGLAMCWNRWQRTEERRRFFGGKLTELSGPNRPPWSPSHANVVTEYTPDESEFFDYAANERLMDRLGQQFMELAVETNLKAKVAGIAGALPLLPDGVVSLQEAHAAASLGDILKYEIIDDVERPGGLRLLEWVRGYAVLKELADSAHAVHPGDDGLTSILTRVDLQSVLQRCGLAPTSAQKFVELVTLKVSSDDLFDSPLVQLHDGSLLIFGPALLTANITNVVLSTLATLDEPLSHKGHALEAAIVALLKKRDLHARSFQVTRNKEVFEYDAVLAWGDYVFVFECKNRSLSGNRPVNAYHFSLGIRSAFRQVKRLAEALYQYPDILANEMQIDVAGKTIVPCVLNSLPYARTGEVEGVYCTDSSVLDRFFADRYFFLKMPYRIRDGLTVMHRVSIASLWKGAKPGPEDLLMQLKEPLQLKLMKAHTQLQPRAFPIGSEHVVAATEFVRTAWDIESISKTFGLSAAHIRKTIEVVGREIRDLKNRVTKKRKRKRAKKAK